MRRRTHGTFLPFLVMTLGGLSLASAADPPKSPGPAKPVDAATLKSTVVTPHLEAPIEAGKNLLWCSTFQVAWNEACTLIGEDIHLTDEPPMVAILNRKAASKSDLDDASYLAMAGWLDQGFRDRAVQAVRQKFGDQAPLGSLPELPDNIRGFASYACLVKNLAFAVPFERQDAFSFRGVPVRAFGFRSLEEADKLRRQVRVLYYDDKRPDSPEAVVELITTSPQDRLILALVEPAPTLGETLAKVRERMAGATPGDFDIRSLYGFSVPFIDLNLLKQYSELLEHQLRVKNPKANDIPVLGAEQSIRFRLDEKGAKLVSHALPGFGGKPRELLFDRPFLVLLQRKDAKTPYFALWVDNPEVLVPADPAAAALFQSLPYVQVEDFSEGLARVAVEGEGRDDQGDPRMKWGFIDTSGRVVIQPQFAEVHDFHDGLARVATEGPREIRGEGGAITVVDGGQWGFIDRTGNTVIKPRFDDLRDFHEGLAAAAVLGQKLDPKWGFISRDGQWVVQPQYDDVGDLEDGRAPVCVGGRLPSFKKESIWGGAEAGKGKLGWIDRSGKLLGGRLFDEVGTFTEGFCRVRSGDAWGFMDHAGSIIAEPKYDEARDFSEGFALVKRGAKYGFVDGTGKLAVDLPLERAESFAEGLALVRMSGKYGFIGPKGQVVIPPLLDDAKTFSEGLAAARSGDNWGYMDKTGKFVVEPRFDEADPFSEGLAAVCVDEKWGYIDKAGKLVVEPQYDSCGPFSAGLAMAHLKDQTAVIDRTGRILASADCNSWIAFEDRPAPGQGLVWMLPRQTAGFMDPSGKLVIQGKYDVVVDLSEGLAAVVMDRKPAFIDRTGRIVIGPQVKYWNYSLPVFSEGLAAIRPDEHWGFMDKTGNYVIEPRFDGARPFSGGFAPVDIIDKVRNQDTWNFIDHAGKLLCETSWDEVGRFREGLACVCKGERWGFIDNSGKLVIPCRFEAAASFSQDLAFACENEKCGFIDKTGKWTIPPRFDDAGSFAEDLAPVELGGKWGYIDKSGRLVKDPEYEEAESFSGGWAVVRINGKFGFVDKNFHVVLAPQFDRVSSFADDRCLVTIGQRSFFIDRAGTLIGPRAYEYAFSFTEGLAAVELCQEGILVSAKGTAVRFTDAYPLTEHFADGLMPVWTHDGAGYVDTNGTFVIKPQFESADNFSEGLAAVQVGGKWGYIDKSGRIVIEPRFDAAARFHGGFARVGLGEIGSGTSIWTGSSNHWGFIDKSGRIITAPRP